MYLKHFNIVLLFSMYMSKTRNAAPVEKGQFSDKFIHDTKVGYALDFAEKILINFLSGESSNINDSNILNKKGINDCVCGLSKRMPGCDGSHKQLAK